MTGIGIAQEQPVLFPKSGGPNGVFHEIVVYLDSAIFEIDTKQGPVGERIIDGLAKSAARQIAAGRFKRTRARCKRWQSNDSGSGAQRPVPVDLPRCRAGSPRCGRG